jgi:hypothetical protein
MLPMASDAFKPGLVESKATAYGSAGKFTCGSRTNNNRDLWNISIPMCRKECNASPDDLHLGLIMTEA